MGNDNIRVLQGAGENTRSSQLRDIAKRYDGNLKEFVIIVFESTPTGAVSVLSSSGSPALLSIASVLLNHGAARAVLAGGL